jgi:hypothetical protein
MADAPESTQEAKRRRRALPNPDQPGIATGCLVSPWVLIVISALWYFGTRSLLAISMGVLGLVSGLLTLAAMIRERLLLARVKLEWGARGVRCLLVHSNSAAWHDHIAEHWIPRLGDRAVLFNWSERAARRGSLETSVFRHFCGERRNFNPAVVVFRGLGQPQVFRFYYAFLEVRAGRPRYLEEQERRMFEALGV